MLKNKLYALTYTLYIFALALQVITVQQNYYIHIVARTVIRRLADPYIISHQADIIFTVPLAIISTIETIKKREKNNIILTLLILAGLVTWIPVQDLKITKTTAGIFAITAALIKSRKERVYNTAINYLLTILIFIEIYAIGYWTLAIINPRINKNPQTGIPNLELEIFHSLDVYLPALTIILVYSWIIIPLTKWKGIPDIKSLEIREKTLEANFIYKKTEENNNKTLRILALISPLIAFILGLIPYLPTTNPRMKPASVDIKYYTRWLEEMDNSTSPYITAFQLAGGSRPLTLILMYTIWKTTNIQLTTMLELTLPFLLALLPISTFILMRNAKEKHRYYSTILTLFSTQTLVGIWSGYYANILAQPIIYAAQHYSKNYIENTDRKTFAIATMLLSLTLLVHSWMFYIGIGVIMIYTGLRIVRRRICKFYLKNFITLLIIPLMLEFIKSSIFNVSTIGETTYKAVQWLSISNFWNLQSNLEYLNTIFLAGFTASVPLYTISIIGIVKLSQNNNTNILLLAWVIGISLFFPFTDYGIQSRLLYSLPIQSLAGKMLSQQKNKGIILLIFLMLFSYTIKSILGCISG